MEGEQKCGLFNVPDNVVKICPSKLIRNMPAFKAGRNSRSHQTQELIWKWFAAHFADGSCRWQNKGWGLAPWSLEFTCFAILPSSRGCFGIRCPLGKCGYADSGEHSTCCVLGDLGDSPPRQREQLGEPGPLKDILAGAKRLGGTRSSLTC